MTAQITYEDCSRKKTSGPMTIAVPALFKKGADALLDVLDDYDIILITARSTCLRSEFYGTRMRMIDLLDFSFVLILTLSFSWRENWIGRENTSLR